MHVNCMCETLPFHTCNIFCIHSLNLHFIAGVILLVAGIAQTSLMFSYLTCLPAVSLEPTTVHKGTLDPMQNLSVEPTELRGSGTIT